MEIQKIEKFPVEQLEEFQENPKVHTARQVAALETSIKKFGFIQPVVCDEKNTILIGHGRTLAAKNLSLATIPVWRISGLSEDQKRALLVADNKLAALTGFDSELLGLNLEILSKSLEFELPELEELGMDFLDPEGPDNEGGASESSGDSEAQQEQIRPAKIRIECRAEDLESITDEIKTLLEKYPDTVLASSSNRIL